MKAPPRYPRVPHLAASVAATSNDTILSEEARRELLTTAVLVEEKLDGMNVSLWVEGGVPYVATRGGPDSSDRSGERGRLKAWANAHHDALVTVLGEDYVLYAEWLRRRHGVAYDHLPGELIGIDVFDRRQKRFLDIGERNATLSNLRVPAPPALYCGVLGSSRRLEALFGTSAFADEHGEGLVVRALHRRLIAKVVDPTWDHIGSLPWSGENRVAV
jgi:RNA ligase-like protein